MPFSPSAAAKKAGVSRSVISRSLKIGDLRGIRKNNGHWSIPDDELDDWMSRTTTRAQVKTDPVTRHEGDIPAQVELATVKARLELLEASVDDLKSDRDAWRKQAETLAASQSKSIISRIFGRG